MSETPAAVPASSEPPDFHEFYASAWPAAVRLAALLTQQTEPAEDLAQEAMVRVYGHWPQVRVGVPGAYLRTTVVNVCNNWHRSRRTQQAKLPLLISERLDTSTSDHLADALAALPFRQRTVLVLRFYEGCSEREIAEHLGCRPGTVKSLTSRALAQLQKVIER